MFFVRPTHIFLPDPGAEKFSERKGQNLIIANFLTVSGDNKNHDPEYVYARYLNSALPPG
jgi:hypothetical protein